MVHELGHFLVARFAGIYTEEFSIGMGPRILKVQGKETVYSLRALPIGGYVKFLGEDEESSDPRAFGNAKLWKRMLVLIAGSGMNLLLAVLLLSILLMCFGTYVPAPVVDKTISGSPAEMAGIQPGDRIIRVAGTDIVNNQDGKAIAQIQSLLKENGGKTINIVVRRDSKEFSYSIDPYYNEEYKTYMIGIEFGFELQRLSFFKAIKSSFIMTGELIVFMVKTLGNLIFKGRGFQDITGPVGIVREIGRAASSGIQDLIWLGIVITINLGVINLIPFPALDGGRLSLLIVEAFRGRPLDQKKEGYIHVIGFILLMLLMAWVTFQDIGKLF